MLCETVQEAGKIHFPDSEEKAEGFQMQCKEAKLQRRWGRYIAA